MRKIAVVAILVVALVSWGTAFAFENEPDGFRGLKWGDPPREDMVYYAKTKGNDDLLWYKRENDKMQIGEAKLKKIIYGFYKNRFMEVRIEVDTLFGGDYDSLKDILNLNFGDREVDVVDLLGYRVETSEWTGDKTTIILQLSIWDWYQLMICSTKINNQCQEDIRRKKEEEARRKEEERQKAAEEGLADFDYIPETKEEENKESREALEKPEIEYLGPAKRKEEGAPKGRGYGIRGPLASAARLIQRQIEPPYPEWAQREGITGVVELKCWVLPSGEVSYVEVYRSSGWPRLDEHARQYLMKWKFEPIKEEKMQWGIVPFHFEFAGERRAKKEAEEGLADFDLPPIPAQQKGDEESKGTLEKERSKTEVPVPTPVLFIQSNPPEASIYINGQPYGSTPKNIHNLKEGIYEIVLSKKGYKTYIKKVHLSLGDEIPIKIDLTPQKGNLIVISEPEGVDVYLDGVYQGKTKLTLEDVIATTHRVTFEKKGYYEEEKEVEVIYKETTTYKVGLKEKPGSLHIISSPQGADVFLDGEYKAKSPLSLSSISPGEHKIKLTKQGRVTYYETVTIKGEQNITLGAILSPNNPPKIISLTTTSEAIRTQETIALTCTATDIDGNNLSYAWFTDKSSIQGHGQKVTYQAPDKPGTYLIRVEVTDENGGRDTKEISITVKEQTVSLKIISYPGGAKIYANEIYEGEAPLTLSNIEVGYYKVKAIKEEEVREKTVYARPKRITSLEFSFAPPPGMVFIPAGEFLMGSNSDYHKNPVHKVYLDAFYIDKYEATNTQFCRFLNEKGNQEEGGQTWLNIEDESSLIECKEGKYQPKPGYENHPVIMVTWYGARAYAKWVGKRLPTEAEWEKAARGGLVGKRYPWGDESPQQEERCNYRGYSGNLTAKMSPLLLFVSSGRHKGTLPVGSFPPNSFGLHDMTGNVEEWCSDWSSSYFVNPYKNPQGPSKGSSRILRSGSWRNLIELDLNCANRKGADPHSSRSSLGFRCAKSAAE